MIGREPYEEKEQWTDEIDGQGSGKTRWQLGRQCPTAPGWEWMGEAWLLGHP